MVTSSAGHNTRRKVSAAAAVSRSDSNTTSSSDNTESPVVTTVDSKEFRSAAARLSYVRQLLLLLPTLVVLVVVVAVVVGHGLSSSSSNSNGNRSTAVVVSRKTTTTTTTTTTVPPTVSKEEVRQQVLQEMAHNESLVNEILQRRPPLPSKPVSTVSPSPTAGASSRLDVSTASAAVDTLRWEHVRQWRARLRREYHLNTPQSLTSSWTTTHWPGLERSLQTPNYAPRVLYGSNNKQQQQPQQLPRRFRPMLQEWQNRSFADVQIVGLPKAGTSQLYHILTQHPQLYPLKASDKECCTLKNQTQHDAVAYLWEDADFSSRRAKEARLNVQRSMYRFHKARSAGVLRYYRKHASSQQQRSIANPRTVNACLWIQDVILNYEYLQRPPHVRFILLLRDPADWLWSVWNFFVQPDTDGDATTTTTTEDSDGRPATWSHPRRHYRSPELFHEWVVSGNKTVAGRRLRGYQLEAFYMPLRLLRWFGRDNIWIVKSEEMMPDRIDTPDGFLDQLANFVQVPRAQFDPETYTKRRNCGDAKGSGQVCTSNNKQKKSSSSGAYEIAGYRTLLPETRRIIYLQYWRHCRWWADEFQIEYPECLRAFDEEDTNNKPAS